jgi:hypothetical protein
MRAGSLRHSVARTIERGLGVVGSKESLPRTKDNRRAEDIKEPYRHICM